MRRALGFCALAALLSACETIPVGPNYPDPDVENPGLIVVAQPVATPPPAPVVSTPPPAPSEPPPEPVVEVPAVQPPNQAFAALPYWSTHDPRPALQAFVRGCAAWVDADQFAFLNPNLPQYGTFGDWASACQSAAVLESVEPSSADARLYFEGWFTPVALSTPTASDGLLTGYYEPEVEVRITPDQTFSEPILAKPTSEAALKRPRAQVNARSSRVIAYGRPIDVFFLQIQGSGRLRYTDGPLAGQVRRAAYAANNGQTYRSIGGVLIRRGELTRENASKQSIAAWMTRNGPVKTRALMNENPRYIYFTEQAIRPGEGPQGAMRVPLTGMGAAAVDPRYHPYGSLVWLDTTLPIAPGDYRGARTGVLVAMQDTGGAIKGPLRADLFFGSGDEAGDRAGVQKHRARWTLLLPQAVVARSQ